MSDIRIDEKMKLMDLATRHPDDLASDYQDRYRKMLALIEDGEGFVDKD